MPASGSRQAAGSTAIAHSSGGRSEPTTQIRCVYAERWDATAARPRSRATTGGVATAYNTNTKVGQPIAGAHIDKCAQQRRTQGANAFTTDVRFIVGSFIGSNDSARIRSSASESVGAVSFAFAIS